MLSHFLKQSKEVFFQPRMGVMEVDQMAQGLKLVKKVAHNTVGTITLDSYTRQYNNQKIHEAFKKKWPLNGFPLLYHSVDSIKKHLTILQDDTFPIQIRHGMPQPYQMIVKMLNCGFTITEGGPISYCLPYSRLPLKKSFQSWQDSLSLLAQHNGHVESFAGCMMGQLSPPSLLITLNILEGLFFRSMGLKDISLSYAQGYNLQQDYISVLVLHQMAKKYLNDIEWHSVIYTFMGIYPQTTSGHQKILLESLRLAIQTPSRRLIYKTRFEASRIPSINENIDELNFLSYSVSTQTRKKIIIDEEEYNHLLQETQSLITSVLKLDDHLEAAIIKAFSQGLLDVPYCLHPDNKGRITSWIDTKGYVRWTHPFSIKNLIPPSKKSAEFFLKALNYHRYRCDENESG